MPAGFFSIEHLRAVPGMQSMRTAQVQGTARAQNAEKLGGHIPIPEQMLQNLKTNYFIELSGLAGEIVKIPSLEVQSRRVCPLVHDQELPRFLHLLLLEVHGNNTGPALICQPGKVPIATASVEHVS
jgi:hypothetical protein